MAGQLASITGPLVRPLGKNAEQARWESPIIAFAQTFNGGQQIGASRFADRFTGQLHWMNAGKNREELLGVRMRRAASVIGRDNPRKAEKAAYVFARQLLNCGLVDLADRAMRFGAMHFLGESTRRELDLSDVALREAVFERLISAGLAVRTDTSMFPSKWGLDESWVLIKRPLDHGQFDEESRKYVGIPLLQRKIDPTRPDDNELGDDEKRFISFRRDPKTITKYHNAWLQKLDRLEQDAGIPVARPVHHVNENLSLRSWKVGARKWNLSFPQVGLNTSQVEAAEKEFKRVVNQGREAGIWTGLSDGLVARNLVYQLSGSPKPQWIAIEP